MTAALPAGLALSADVIRLTIVLFGIGVILTVAVWVAVTRWRMRRRPLAGTPVRRRLDADCELDEWADLCMALGGSTASFTGLLLTLCEKADPFNRRRLALGFPRHVAAYRLWVNQGGRGLTAGQLYDHLDTIKDA